jgi:hypothetical protein
MAPTRPGKKKSAAEARKQRALKAAAYREMNRSIDRLIERWARKLLLITDEGVRKLTEDEVQVAVYGSKRRPTRKAKQRTKKCPKTPSRGGH